MSLLAEPADVSSAAVVQTPYGLPDNPFNTTDPTRQQLNPDRAAGRVDRPGLSYSRRLHAGVARRVMVAVPERCVGWTQQNGQGHHLHVAGLRAARNRLSAPHRHRHEHSGKRQGHGNQPDARPGDGRLGCQEPDDAVYLPQLAGITGNGNTWVYKPITQTVVLDPESGML